MSSSSSLACSHSSSIAVKLAVFLAQGVVLARGAAASATVSDPTNAGDWQRRTGGGVRSAGAVTASTRRGSPGAVLTIACCLSRKR